LILSVFALQYEHDLTEDYNEGVDAFLSFLLGNAPELEDTPAALPAPDQVLRLTQGEVGVAEPGPAGGPEPSSSSASDESDEDEEDEDESGESETEPETGEEDDSGHAPDVKALFLRYAATYVVVLLVKFFSYSLFA
jgi:hypothetical protein